MKRKSLRQILQDWKIRRIFKSVVDSRTLELLLQKANQLGTPLTQARIEYVLVFVRGENVSEIAERVDAVVTLAIKHEATVHDVISGLVVAAFGTHRSSRAEAGGRASLIEALKSELASHIKIVHGVSLGFAGLLGSNERLSYGFVVPNFDQILGTLGRLQFGEIEES
jgi:hypothetical protein